jgi:hypothetical protein
VHHAEVVEHRDTPMVTVVEFEPDGQPQIALVPGEAVRLLFRVIESINRKDTATVLADLARADSLVRDRPARMFKAQVAGNRAMLLALKGPLDEAEREAHRGIALWPLNVYAHHALAVAEYRRGHMLEAAAQAETVLNVVPNHQGARAVLDAIRSRAGGAQH